MLDVHIQKGTSVSIHKQLVTQISMQIASGLLKPGTKLPSIRALSRKLQIHYNTALAAYRELKDTGLISIRHGSGVTVLKPDEQQKALVEAVSNIDRVDLDQMARFFVKHAVGKGYGREEILSAVEAAWQNQAGVASRRLTYVDVHADILPLFQTELQQFLNRPVEACTMSDVEQAETLDGHFIVSRYHCRTLEPILVRAGLNPRERMIIIDVGSGQQELEVIRQLPVGSLVAIISCSTIILQQGEAVVTAVRGDEIFVRAMLYPQEGEEEARRLMQRAKAIFSDTVCVGTLEALTRRAVYPIRVIPESELLKLSAFKVSDAVTAAG